MISPVRVAIRVVVYTPILILMYGVSKSPILLLHRTTKSGGVDLVGLATGLINLPNIHVVAPAAALLAVIGPHLPAGYRQGGDE